MSSSTVNSNYLHVGDGFSQVDIGEERGDMIGREFILVGLLDHAKGSQSTQDVAQQSRCCAGYFCELDKRQRLLAFVQNGKDIEVNSNLGHSKVERLSKRFSSGHPFQIEASVWGADSLHLPI